MSETSFYFWLGRAGDHNLPPIDRRVLMIDIQRHVAEHFQLPYRTMTFEGRSRAFARPRQIAMYLGRHYTKLSLGSIGERFGNRDHTTVLHGIRKVEELRAEDPDFDLTVRMIAGTLEARS